MQLIITTSNTGINKFAHLHLTCFRAGVSEFVCTRAPIMKVFGFICCASLLFAPIFSASRKRNASENVHQLGSLQKKSRFQEVQAIAEEKKEDGLSAPEPMEVDSPLAPIQVLSDIHEEVRKMPTWRKCKENLKAITLNGQDVAATLSGKESFFFDLPYADCVLPSMQAGEPFFVPVFLQNVLLPIWLGKRGPLTDQERAVIRLSRRSLYPAMADYLRTVFMASVLQMRHPLKFNDIRANYTNDRLNNYISEFFGVSIFDKLGVDEWTVDTVREWISRNLKTVPSLVLIGKQWGFDDVKIAAKILGMKCLDRNYLESLNIPLNGNTALFLRVISQGLNKLSNLDDLTVNAVAWTMNPTFIFKKDPVLSHQIVVPQEHFEIRPALSPLFALDRASSWRDLLSTLKAKVPQCNPINIPSWPVNKPKVSSDSLSKEEEVSDKSRAKKVKSPKTAEKKEKVSKDQKEVIDAPKKKTSNRQNRLARNHEKESAFQEVQVESPQTIEMHDQAIGFEPVDLVDMSHPAWYSPERSDTLFLSSSIEVPAICGGCGEPSKDSNWKEEDHEDFFRSNFHEDPLNLFDDPYGFRISSRRYSDHLSSDCEFD